MPTDQETIRALEGQLDDLSDNLVRAERSINEVEADNATLRDERDRLRKVVDDVQYTVANE